MSRPAVFLAALMLLSIAAPGQDGSGAAKTLDLLRRIHDEVRSMIPPGDGGPAQQDFFIGGPDDDDTNKDVHVVVLLYRADEGGMMRIQVTRLARSKADRRVKSALDSRGWTCRIEGSRINIVSSDVPEQEIGRTAADLLKAIADKKRLIKG